MALPLHALKVIAPYLKGADVLSLGYPDLIASAKQINTLFGITPTRFTEAHKYHGLKDPLPDSEEVFEKVGANLTIIDFKQTRGMERVANLNEPHDLGKFDIVIDPGTLEHCFNIGQAMFNVANAVKLDGRVLHISPMNMMNHGFYNICPTFYHDFYTQNGWTADMTILPVRNMQVDAHKRFFPYMEFIIRCLAFKETEGPLKFPIQTKYLEKT